LLKIDERGINFLVVIKVKILEIAFLRKKIRKISLKIAIFAIL
jgi:hypothetical protein